MTVTAIATDVPEQVIYPSGLIGYLLRGGYHWVDGPARICADGTEERPLYGLPHRIDRPRCYEEGQHQRMVHSWAAEPELPMNSQQDEPETTETLTVNEEATLRFLKSGPATPMSDAEANENRRVLAKERRISEQSR